MPDQTKIEWTDFTVNFWEGCQKVGPGCDHCYAEARDVRFTGGSHWGPGAPRRKVKGGIAKLRRIQDTAMKFHNENGYWPRVFCSSLSDVFDNAVDEAWRTEAFAEIESATNCRFQLLTKRVGNVEKMVPFGWGTRDPWPKHVGLMITVVDQKEADRDIPKLLDLKARLSIPWIGLSIEPMLGPIKLDRMDYPPVDWINCLTGDHNDCDSGIERLSTIDWVICGGESGHMARPTNPQWFRDVRDQCEASGTPFLFKQWGEWVSVSEVEGPGRHHKFDDGRTVRRVGKAKAGRLLDGRTWDGVVT
jgi:protein gp37